MASSATANLSSIEITSAAAAAAVQSAAPSAADSRGRRPAWSVPLNGAIEASHVMDAASWPALSDSAKASANSSSSSESLKSLSDGSASAPTLLLASSSPPKSDTGSLTLTPVQNPMSPSRQIAGGSGSGNGSGSGTPSGPALPPAFVEIPASEPSPRAPRNGGPHFSGDHHRGFGGGNRRGPATGGAHHRRDQEWNHQRTHHPPPRGGFRSFPRAPPPPPMSPPIMRPPLRPFPGNPMGFHDVPPPIYIMPQPPSVPFVPYQVPNAMFFPALDSLRAQLLHQIEYYFSEQNLSRDEFLRRHMDDQGWVPISVIARFNRVTLLTNQLMPLTNNIQLFILETMRLSTVVEVQGEKIRRRNDWRNYLLSDGVATRLTNLNIRG